MKALSLASLLILVAFPAFSAQPEMRERGFGPDRFAAGGVVSVTNPVAGDLFAAGGNIDVDAAVGGDAIVAGGNLRIAGPVGQDLYAAGGRVNVNGTVQRNVRLAGGHIEIGPRAKISGNVSVGGGEARISGAIGGYLQVGGGSVFLDGPVAGDVEVGGGSVELGPGARIGGRLRYASREEIRQDSAAQVRGGVERIPLPEAARNRTTIARERAARGIHWIWSAGMIVLAAVLALAFPGVFSGTAAALRMRWGYSLLAGFIAFVCIPAASLIALVTVIGIPLALAAIALYFALLLIGYATAGMSAGALALQRWQPARASKGGWRLLFAALGMLVLCLLAAIPYLGGFIVLVAMLLGIGLLLLQRKQGLAA